MPSINRPQMNWLDWLLHLLGFVAPALALGVLVASASRAFGREARRLPLWASALLLSLVGMAVLLAGLWHFGVDGKMATYAALVVAVASAEWLTGRGWRRQG